MENEDGKILSQVPGKPVYTATLVKYAEQEIRKLISEMMHALEEIHQGIWLWQGREGEERIAFCIGGEGGQIWDLKNEPASQS